MTIPAKALLAQGRQASLDGRFEAAAKLFLDACELDPLLDEAQAGLIGALEAMGRYDLSAAALGKTRIDRAGQRHRIDWMLLDHLPQQGAAGLLEKRAIGAIQVEIILADYYQRPGSFLDVEKHLVGKGWRLAALFDIFPDLAQPLFQLDALYLPA